MEGLRGMWGFGLLLTGGGILLLIRAIVIQLGKAKGPLLERFETALDVSIHYNSLRDLAIDGAMVWAGAVLLIGHFTNISASWLLPVSAMLALSALAHWLGELLRPVMPKPAWYQCVIQKTTPEDRRRLAYAWQKISPAMRAHYNAQDEAFFSWVDLVMLATTN